MIVAPTLAGYQLRLTGFDGPLDVLLSMIDERRLEITTLSLVEVTDGFVAYVSELVDPPPALLAEFIGVAARLLVLKSRALIPRPPGDPADEEVIDITQQLEQYRRIRANSAILRAREAHVWRSHGRAAAPLRRFVNTTFVLPSVAELRTAYRRVTARPAVPDLPHPVIVQISIQEMIERIQGRLRRQVEPLRFREAVGRERAHIVAGFVALLTLWARRSVDLSQDDLFGEILILQPPPTNQSAQQSMAQA